MNKLGMLAAMAAAAIATSSRAADYTFSFMGGPEHPGVVTGTIYGLADSGTSAPTSVVASSNGDTYTFTVGDDGISAGGGFTISNGRITMDDYTIHHSYVDTPEGQDFTLNTSGYNLFEEDARGVVVENEDGISSVTFALIPGTSAAPEPSSWALMFAGVGLVGFALRSRRRLCAAAA